MLKPFAMPAGSEVAKDLDTHAYVVLAGKKQTVDHWESDKGWMWNTRSLQTAIGKDLMLKNVSRAPILCCPWSMALTVKLIPDLEVAEAQAGAMPVQ
jgi:hypothetical protein